MKTLLNTQSPALPIADDLITPGFQNNYSNVLRLYFNQIDNVTGVLLGPLGTAYLDAPHATASDTTNQYATGNNIPTRVLFNTPESVNGFTLNPDGTAQVEVAGIYRIEYSIQFVNTDNASHDVFVWLQENGTQIARSSSRFTLPARKSTGDPAYLVAYSFVVFEAQPDNRIGLWWATEKAYNPVGPVNGVYMDSLPAQTSPYVRPANPSAIGSITFLSRLPPTP